MSYRSYRDERRATLEAREARRVARDPSVRPPARAVSVGGYDRPTLVALAVVVIGASMLMLAGNARAAGSAVELESPRIDQGNEKSLQRGAKHFFNNCFGCHSAGYNRYSRVAQDLGLSEADVEQNFIFTTDADGEPTKVGSLITNTMSTEYGQQAFGVMPPNLSLTARSRGTDWIYSFLKTFYLDPDRPNGVNNLVYPGTAMPHVLWNYQGYQALQVEEVIGDGAAVGDHDVVAAPSLELIEAGLLSADEYDDMIADITNFLAYMAEPIKTTRVRVGIIVMFFLFGLLAVAYFLKKEYWKDVV